MTQPGAALPLHNGRVAETKWYREVVDEGTESLAGSLIYGYILSPAEVAALAAPVAGGLDVERLAEAIGLTLGYIDREIATEIAAHYAAALSTP